MRCEFLLLFCTVAASLTLNGRVAARLRPRRSRGATGIAAADGVLSPATVIAAGTATADRSARRRRLLHVRSRRRHRDYDAVASTDSADRQHREPVAESKTRRRQTINAPLNEYRQTTTHDYDNVFTGYDESDEPVTAAAAAAATTVKSYKNNDKYENTISEQCDSDSWTKYFPTIFVAVVLITYPFLNFCCKSSKFNKDKIYLQLNNCRCSAKYCNLSKNHNFCYNAHK